MYHFTTVLGMGPAYGYSQKVHLRFSVTADFVRLTNYYIIIIIIIIKRGHGVQESRSEKF